MEGLFWTSIDMVKDVIEAAIVNVPVNTQTASNILLRTVNKTFHQEGRQKALTD